MAEFRWVLVGDCRVKLRELGDCSVDSVVTDPPYELGFMGKSWDSTGVAYDVGLWREVLRVLKPGGHLLAFGGSRTYHRLACAVEDAGFEIRDQIMWVYGSGFPKSLNVGKQDGCDAWEGWGTALKPAHEPIVLARKLLDGTVANNVLQHGTGALNIDATRVPFGEEQINLSRKQRQQQFEGGIDFGAGRLVGTEINTYKEGGRWPANFIHDGSDEVLQLFPDTGKSQGQRAANKGGVTNLKLGGSNEPTGYGDSGSAARFFYCAKASKTDRNEGLDDFAPKRDADRVRDDGVGGANPRNRSNTAKVNHHPTVKPTMLMRYLVRLVTPPDGVVLDPFCGSGSTGKAAILEGFNFIGIEQSDEYAQIAEARIKHVE